MSVTIPQFERTVSEQSRLKKQWAVFCISHVCWSSMLLWTNTKPTPRNTMSESSASKQNARKPWITDKTVHFQQQWTFYTILTCSFLFPRLCSFFVCFHKALLQKLAFSMVTTPIILGLKFLNFDLWISMWVRWRTANYCSRSLIPVQKPTSSQRWESSQKRPEGYLPISHHPLGEHYSILSNFPS